MLNPRIGWSLGSFLHRVARRITRKKPMRRDEGGSEYPPLTAAMDEVGFNETRIYIIKSQDMIAQYIVTRPILYLCKRSVQRPTAWVYQRWWEQEGINLPGKKRERWRQRMGRGGRGKKRRRRRRQQART